MTSQPRSQCSTCVHFRSPLDVGDGTGPATCAAFPAEIPSAVYRNLLDHRVPIEGDGGVQWESDGRDFPEYAMAGATLDPPGMDELPDE